jgi:hypothetical protein
MKTIKILGLLLALVVGTLTVNAQTKTYSRYGVSITYPSFLNIEGENYAGGELNLLLSSNDQMNLLVLAVSTDDVMIQSINMYGLETVFDNFKSQMVGEGVEFGTVKKDDNNITMPFTFSFDGTLLHGEASMTVKNGTIIFTMITARPGDKYNAIKQACKTIKVS